MCARVRVFFLCSASLLASQANPVRELSFFKVDFTAGFRSKFSWNGEDDVFTPLSEQVK